MKIRAKDTITPNAHPEATEATKTEFLRYWNTTVEQESKVSFTKELGHTLKFLWDTNRTPKAILTTLYNRKPLLMGVNYTFDAESPKYTGQFEVLLGARPYKEWMTYLRQYARIAL